MVSTGVCRHFPGGAQTAAPWTSPTVVHVSSLRMWTCVSSNAASFAARARKSPLGKRNRQNGSSSKARAMTWDNASVSAAVALRTSGTASRYRYDLGMDVAAQGALVKAAAREVALASTDTKNAALVAAADVLLARSGGDPRRQRRGCRGGRSRGHQPNGHRSPAFDRGAHRGDGRRAAAGGRRCRIPSAKCSMVGCGPTGWRSDACACPSAWSRSSTRTGPTSRPTRRPCA